MRGQGPYGYHEEDRGQRYMFCKVWGLETRVLDVCDVLLEKGRIMKRYVHGKAAYKQ